VAYEDILQYHGFPGGEKFDMLIKDILELGQKDMIEP
jgi:hypothetical protein